MLVLVGCEKGREDGPAPAAATATATARSPRPEALSAAADDIRGGRPAEAQKRVEGFLEQEPKSLYAPEAKYLLGQSIAAQGEHEKAKKVLDDAIDNTEDRTLKALAMLGRADCNLAMGKFSLASRQYHWLETMYRDVKAVPQDEVMYKLGMSCKKAGFTETADYWFNQVVNLYSTGPYFEKAKMENSKFTPPEPGAAPRIYTLEVSQFAKKEKAESEAAIMREKGYRDVQVVETTQNSFPVYQVHIGKFANESDAIRAQTDAELAGLKVKPHPAIIEPLK
ncbi:MAG TPA: tetratricopeptide repeat protein [Planctomycetota bacterium]|jgi:TolA-binding protein